MPTFTIETEPFTVGSVTRIVTLSGEMQVRRRDPHDLTAPFVYAPFSGDPADGVPFLLGKFSEQVSGMSVNAITRSGNFILTPPSVDYTSAAAVPTTVGLTTVSAQSPSLTLLPLILLGLATLLIKRRR
jgi:hypothetical protein